MIGDEFVITVECEPRRTPSPAASLEARSEHVIKSCRAFGRAVSEARRPVCPRKLPMSMLKAQVNNAGHRGACIGKLTAAGDGRKFVIFSSCPSGMALPLWAGYNVEVARGDAPARVHDVSNDRPERLPLTIALMGAICGDETHWRRVSGTPPMPKVEGNRHGFGIEVWRTTGARLALEPREEKAAGRTCRAVGASPSVRATRVEMMTVPRGAEPRTQTARVSRFVQRAANLIENYVCRRVSAAQQGVEHIVARSSSSLLLVITTLSVAAPPSGRIPNEEGLWAGGRWHHRWHQIRDQNGGGNDPDGRGGGRAGVEWRGGSKAQSGGCGDIRIWRESTKGWSHVGWIVVLE